MSPSGIADGPTAHAPSALHGAIYGSCFCKRTTFEIPQPQKTLAMSVFCHCSLCSRLAGAPFIWTTHWQGEDSVRWSVAGSTEGPVRFAVVEGVKWRLRCPDCGTMCGSWNEPKQKSVLLDVPRLPEIHRNSNSDPLFVCRWSVWPVLFSRNIETKRLLIQDDADVWAWIKPTGHIFYGTRVLDIDDGLGKWEGYEGQSTKSN
jgi:hypothetical protein